MQLTTKTSATNLDQIKAVVARFKAIMQGRAGRVYLDEVNTGDHDDHVFVDASLTLDDGEYVECAFKIYTASYVDNSLLGELDQITPNYLFFKMCAVFDLSPKNGYWVEA